MSGVVDWWHDTVSQAFGMPTLAEEEAQRQLNKQNALNKARHDANVTAATAGASLQKETAQGQYDLAQANENTKFQTDDQAQLDAINKAIQDPSLSLDAKLALIDGQVKAGLGTESAKLALNARMLAQQEFDLNGAGGAADLQRQQMELQKKQLLAKGDQMDAQDRRDLETLNRALTGAKENIMALGQQRDAGLAQSANASAAMGLSGEGIDRQVGAQTYGSDRQISSAANQAGYVLEQTPGELAKMSVFDQALHASLTGRNIGSELLAASQVEGHQNYQAGLDAFALDSKTFEANIAKARVGLDSSRTGFGFDVYGLGAADTAFRASADFGLQTNIKSADLNLTNAMNDANFSFDQQNINTEGQQYRIDKAVSDGPMNLLQGVTQVALWATAPGVGAAMKGFSEWWGSNFGGSDMPGIQPMNSQPGGGNYGW